MGDELHELPRLLVEADHVQAPEREARVPDPGVAVVPVALPARRLRKRGGQRGDHRPGRLVGEPLERQRRALQGPAPRVVGEVPALQPAPPQVLTVPWTSRTASAASVGPAELLTPRQAREAALAGLERAHAAGDPAVELERDVPEQAHRLAAAARVRGEPVLVDQPPARLLGRVVEGGLADQPPPRSSRGRTRPCAGACARRPARPAPGRARPRRPRRSGGASTSASWTTIQPVAVIQLVSSTFVPGTYRRATGARRLRGPRRKAPAPRSSSAPNTLGESKRGRHSHSTVPSDATSAPVWQSERKP